jgi:hypothetical protein
MNKAAIRSDASTMTTGTAAGVPITLIVSEAHNAALTGFRVFLNGLRVHDAVFSTETRIVGGVEFVAVVAVSLPGSAVTADAMTLLVEYFDIQEVV